MFKTFSSFDISVDKITTDTKAQKKIGKSFFRRLVYNFCVSASLWFNLRHEIY